LSQSKGESPWKKANILQGMLQWLPLLMVPTVNAFSMFLREVSEDRTEIKIDPQNVKVTVPT
jgi:hypothetical protein